MSRLRAILVTATIFLLVIAVALTVQYYGVWQHWIAYAVGAYNVPGVAHNYNAFSGSLSDISELGILVAMATIGYHIFRRGNCHTHGCWRIGGYPVGTYKVCKKHHKEVVGTDPTIAHLKAHHRRFHEAS